jgi:acyl carrier protein
MDFVRYPLVYLEVRELAKVVIPDLEGKDIKLDSRLEEDLGLDGMDCDDIVEAIEGQLEMFVSEDAAHGFATVREVVDYISDNIDNNSELAMQDRSVYEMVLGRVQQLIMVHKGGKKVTDPDKPYKLNKRMLSAIGSAFYITPELDCERMTPKELASYVFEAMVEQDSKQLRFYLFRSRNKKP